MTLPHERTNALIRTKKLLKSLLDKSKTPRVPKMVRLDAYWCLRHYPFDFEIDEMAKKCPKILGRMKE